MPFSNYSQYLVVSRNSANGIKILIINGIKEVGVGRGSTDHR